MEKLKIFVRTKEESQEAQSLFFKMGLYWFGSKDELHSNRIGVLFTTNLQGKDIMTFSLEGDAELPNHKEITLPELRDMVVLKRNDVGDATHESPNKELKFTLIGDWWNLFTGGKWQQFCHIESPRSAKLKPIEKKEMKEYLIKDPETNFYYVSSSREHGFVAEVPEGAEIATLNIRGIGFFKNRSAYNPELGKWDDDFGLTINDLLRGANVVWQRDESLNDKVASGESYSSMSQTTFIERELCKSSLNHTVANAFRAIRNDVVRLTEDDVRLIQELTELAKAHGDVWK